MDMEELETNEAPVEVAPKTASPSTEELAALRESVAQTNQAVSQLAHTLGEAARPKTVERDWFADEEVRRAYEEERLGTHLRKGMEAELARFREREIAPLEQNGLGAVEALTRRVSKTAEDLDPQLENEVQAQLKRLPPAQRANIEVVDQVRALVYGSPEARRRREAEIEKRLRSQFEQEAREGRIQIEGVTPPRAPAATSGPTPADLFRQGIISPAAAAELKKLDKRGELDQWARESTHGMCKNFRGWARMHGYQPED